MTSTLHLGDCLDVLRTLEAGSVDAIVTDPPYGLGDRWTGGKREWPLKDEGNGTKWDAARFDGLAEMVAGFRYAIVWGGHLYGLPPTRGWLVWDKIVRKFTSGHCELAWTNLDQPIRAFNCSHGQLAHEGKVHPTQKPLRLMEWCLSFLPEGCTVFDPFMGSGATGAACMKTGRNFIGCEIDPTYFAIAERRIAEARDATPLFAIA
jgi:site-specific DNA-methyltransferase (adenine-specific)